MSSVMIPRWTVSAGPVKRRDDDATMRFGVFWPHSATLMPSTTFASAPDLMDVQRHIDFAQAAEAAGFDFAFIADGYAPDSEEASAVRFRDPRPGALYWALPIFLATRTLGVVTTLHTAYLHPVHIARAGAQLDWISQGRWGWNVVTGYRQQEAALFGLDGLLDHDTRYDQADEAIDIAEGLWRTRSGEFTYNGSAFRTSGRLAGPHPLQDPPMKVSAGVSPRGKRLAARRCDYIFAPIQDDAQYAPLAVEMAELGEQHGRRDGTACVPLVSRLMHVHDDPGRAAEEFDELAATIHVPAMAADRENWKKGSQSHAQAEERRPAGIVGTVDEVAEQLIDAHRRHGVRGMLLPMLHWTPEAAAAVGRVFDRLERAAVWVRPERRGHSW
jgi:FMNH2-dependent dimethyl sulfone monooxygenase